MISYKTMMHIVHGSKRYKFDGTELTLSDYYDGTEAKFDFGAMTEETFGDLVTNDVEYKKAMRILRGSKEYQFEGTELTVKDYYTGDAVNIEFANMTEEMFEELAMEEEMEEELDDDLDDDFSDAVDAVGQEDGVSL